MIQLPAYIIPFNNRYTREEHVECMLCKRYYKTNYLFRHCKTNKHNALLLFSFWDAPDPPTYESLHIFRKLIKIIRYIPEHLKEKYIENSIYNALLLE